MNEDGTKARGIIAIVIATALAVLAIVVFFLRPDPSVEKYALLILGALIAFTADIKQFYFGSSSGAKQLVANQNEIVKAVTSGTGNGIANAAPAGTPADPVAVTEVPKADIPIDPTIAALKSAGVDEKALTVALAAMKASRLQ